MLKMSDELIEKMKRISGQLQKEYRSFYDREEIRKKLEKSGAQLSVVTPLSKSELVDMLNGREIAAVDGSVNQTKGTEPHVIYFFQALAKTTTGHACFTSDIYTPLFETSEEEDAGVHARKQILAKLELDVALQLIEEREIAFLLMDGALYHYRIDEPDKWEKLRQKALEKNVLLVGVSEEITTENLSKIEPFASSRLPKKVFDRDLLFGVLDYKEIVYIEEIQQKAGLASIWCRFSRDPAITGFDLLTEQAIRKEEVARLLLTLTPEHGRGIPLWLDHIDREVRLTDEMVDAFVEQYVDEDVRRRLFVQKRLERPY